jgi:hypothetical protein
MLCSLTRLEFGIVRGQHLRPESTVQSSSSGPVAMMSGSGRAPANALASTRVPRSASVDAELIDDRKAPVSGDGKVAKLKLERSFPANERRIAHSGYRLRR